MRTDVAITYENGQLHVRSEAARYEMSRPAVVVLSRGPDGVEVFEAIGEPFDIEMQKTAWARDKGARAYRAFDPFEVGRFEPDAAAMAVRHFCYVAHGKIKPRRGLWRAFLRIDRFHLRVKIPHYLKLPVEKRAAFERHLRKYISQVEVGD